MDEVKRFKELELDVMVKHIVDEEKRANELRGSKDVSKDRWMYTWRNLYQMLFAEREFWKETDFKKVIDGGTENAHIVYSGSGCDISGDTCFNFKPVKYEGFETKIIYDKELDNDKKQKALAELKKCMEMNYSLHNFSLMPQTGNMQWFKENCGGKLDRLDSFLYHLNGYFCKREKVSENSELYTEMIFKYANGRESNIRTKEENTKLIRDGLISFLDEFRKGEKIKGKEGVCSATYKYCNEMYLIDYKEEENRKLVEDLIENGSKPIKTGDNVIRYMNLAKRYWKIKDELLKQAESRE